MLCIRIIVFLAPLITFVSHSMEKTPQSRQPLPTTRYDVTNLEETIQPRQPLHTIQYDFTNLSTRVIKTCFYEQYIGDSHPVLHTKKLRPREWVQRLLPKTNNGLEPAEYNYRVVVSNSALSFCAAHNSEFSGNSDSDINLETLLAEKVPLEKIIHNHATVTAQFDEQGRLNVGLEHRTGMQKNQK